MCINNTSSSPLLYQTQSTEYKAIFARAESTEQLSSKSGPRIREMPVFNAVDIAQVLPSLRIGENITAINYLGNSVTIPLDELEAFLTENNPSLILYGVSISLCGTLLVILLGYFLHPDTDGQS